MRVIVLLFIFLVLSVRPAGAALVNRWSFNNSIGAAPAGTAIVDSISGSNGVVVGTGGTFSGVALAIPGATSGNQTPAAISAYVDLPNRLISSKTNLTLEIWYTVTATRNWQRLFDFGRMNIAGSGPGAEQGEVVPNAVSAPGGTSSSDNLMVAINRGTSPNTQRLAARLNGAAEVAADSGFSVANGNQYHFVLVVEDGAGSFGSGGMQIRGYHNGTLVQSVDAGFKLASIEDVNNWLGRSQFSGDSQSSISYNEVRLYDHALSPQEIVSSRTAGPEPAAPAAANDAVTLRHGHKVRVPVLANDSGGLFPGSVNVTALPEFGSAVPTANGEILYAHTNGTAEQDSFSYTVSGIGGTSAPATVTLHFSTDLRLTNNTLNVPATPPPTALELVNAFPGLSFSQPVCLRTPPGETNRLFVCEKTGLVRVVPDLSAASFSAPTFLNLPALLTSRSEAISTGSEQGLLGLAFHPGYATNGFFFVHYSVGSGGTIYNRVSRFSVQPGSPNAADPASERILFQQADTAGNHNGGDLHFGPDGYLYVSLGDGGDQNDSQNHAQKINDGFFAAIARIDVDRRPGNIEPNPHSGVPLYSGFAAYAVPVDNPYVGATTFNGSAVNSNSVRTELWAVGFRNPWRMSFDLVTSNLWVGDVGQGTFEEVNLVTRGGNYGWAFREGNNNGPKAAPPNFDTLYHSRPLYVYAHGGGSMQGDSITGGVVYRGTRIPHLFGAYIFSDYVSGNIWSLRQTNASVNVERIAGQAGIVAFGIDPANSDVLLADINGGRVLRLTSGTPAGSYPLTLSETRVFADVSDFSPSPGLVSYEPNLPFWSDYAVKSRWFIIPDATNRMTWSREDNWIFPTNQIWVKHFDLEMERGNPATKRRLETRLLVRNADGAYGVSYQWNEAQTEATLAPDAGVDFALVITNGGNIHTQTWHIPSRAECMACHTPQAGHALSFTTRQMNREATMDGFTGNQLELLHAAGYFTNEPEPVSTLPRHATAGDITSSLEHRARSYIDVNCAYCHQPGGTGGGNWDGRARTPLFQTGMINGDAINNNGDPNNKLIVPGDPVHSVIWNRMASTNGFTRMPPIATNERDEENIALLAQWIQDFGTNRQAFADWQVAHFGSTNDPNGGVSGDPDLDGRVNQHEYFAGTDPHAIDSTPDLALHVAPDGAALVQFSLGENAAARVQTSTNLLDWEIWNAAGNNGIPGIENPQSVEGAVTNEAQYFRLLLNER